MSSLTLISHNLCPYVQRAAIAMLEKGTAFDRVYVDLTNKPDWFKVLSPLGKVPALTIDEGTRRVTLFESAVILEYLEETQAKPLHPRDPLTRAEHRSWIEYGSSILGDIWGFYSAPDRIAFEGKVAILESKFQRLESRLGKSPYFEGRFFSLVDAAFGSIFRYFDVFDQIDDFGILSGKPKLCAWRVVLAERDSIQAAVSGDYKTRLLNFLKAQESHFSGLLTQQALIHRTKMYPHWL